MLSAKNLSAVGSRPQVTVSKMPSPAHPASIGQRGHFGARTVPFALQEAVHAGGEKVGEQHYLKLHDLEI